ncbi:unnamed protein product [Paramecium pentaurelia]|uniref:Uncharacterized protein n=1 Tax=Paramecium pentaurelia TaxID=43138 RepID=A0A8S1TR65_9CILI|nr:unnamed protein product [Paramecium pentaurelia]
MMSKIPVQYILNKFQDLTKIEIDFQFHFIILSQNFDDPQLENNKGQKQKSKIWVYMEQNQEESQIVLQQDILDYLLCYEEQEQTGLVSILRILKQIGFKTEIDKVVLTNTYFLSIESSEKIDIISTQYEIVYSKNKKQILHEQKNQNLTDQKNNQIKKKSNRLIDQMVILNKLFENLYKSQQQMIIN